MKPSPLRSLATHLAGVAAGGALAYVLVTAPRNEEESPPPKHRSTTLAAKFSPTVTLELERLMEYVEAERLAASTENPPTILQRLEAQEQASRENERELARLQALAGTFVETKDLGPVLTDALATRDRDLTRALFLEWHRRDPASAFDALAQRSGWPEFIDEAVVLAISKDALLAQIARNNRPEWFRSQLATKLGTKLGATDDLRGLTQSLDDAKPQQAHLIEGFVRAWTPDNGAEAARFIGLDMKPDHQRELLAALSGQSILYNFRGWTDEFAAALFDYDLHIPQHIYEKLRINIGRRNESAPVRPTPPAEPLEPGLESGQALRAVAGVLGAALHHQRDYPDLFAAGAIDMDRILADMQASIPGIEHYPDQLKEALFLELAPHNPARAITWATTTIPRADLDRAIVACLDEAVFAPVTSEGPNETSIWSTGPDPRTRRVADLASVLQPSQMPVEENRMTLSWMLMRLGEWSRLAPDTAQESIDRISSNHPIWKLSETETAGP